LQRHRRIGNLTAFDNIGGFLRHVSFKGNSASLFSESNRHSFRITNEIAVLLQEIDDNCMQSRRLATTRNIHHSFASSSSHFSTTSLKPEATRKSATRNPLAVNLRLSSVLPHDHSVNAFSVPKIGRRRKELRKPSKRVKLKP
jgi:hypothetical protein